MTPFHRLALLAGTTLYGLGLASVWLWLDWRAAVAAAAIGVGLSLVSTLELAPSSDGRDATVADTDDDAGDDWTIRQRDRAAIERSARRSRAE